jgi:hypothetical protein
MIFFPFFLDLEQRATGEGQQGDSFWGLAFCLIF